MNGSSIKLPIPEPARGFQFVCRRWSLNTSTLSDEMPFDVQEGDIVGMYVYDPSDDNTVHILGMSTPGEDGGLLKANIVPDNITSPVLNSDLMDNVSYSLYLVAVIGNYYCIMLSCDDPK